jgi:hypothetical protein
MRTGDPPRDPHRLRFPFDGKNLAFQGRHGDPAERLQRMHRPDRRAMRMQRIEHTRIHRTTGVQNNFPEQLFLADARQLLRHNRDFIIRRGDQDYRRRENLPRHYGARFAGSNESNGSPRARFAAGNHSANLPPVFAQAASERASHTSCTDDSQAIWHPWLG